MVLLFLDVPMLTTLYTSNISTYSIPQQPYTIDFPMWEISILPGPALFQ